jgi:hypothetical protein
MKMMSMEPAHALASGLTQMQLGVLAQIETLCTARSRFT